MKRLYRFFAAGIMAVTCFTSAVSARTIALKIDYLGASSTDFDCFNLSLISDDPDVPVGAWEGDFFGSFHQIWNSVGDAPRPTTCSGSPLDTHYLLSSAIGTVSEDNDLSEDHIAAGWGTYLSGGAMMGNQTGTLPLIQIVVPTGTSFTIQGIAADGWGEKYQFDASLSKGDGNIQTIASQLIPPPTPAPSAQPEPAPATPVAPPADPSDPDPEPTPEPQVDKPSFTPIDWMTLYTPVSLTPMTVAAPPQMIRCPDCNPRSVLDRIDWADHRSFLNQWNSYSRNPDLHLTPLPLSPCPLTIDDAIAGSSVPEPLTLGLFLLGGGGLLYRRSGK